MVGARCERSAQAYFDVKKGRGLRANMLSKQQLSTRIALLQHLEIDVVVRAGLSGTCEYVTGIFSAFAFAKEVLIGCLVYANPPESRLKGEAVAVVQCCNFR